MNTRCKLFSSTAIVRLAGGVALIAGLSTAPLAQAAESNAQLAKKLEALQQQLQSMQGLQEQVRQLQQQLQAVKAGEDEVAKKQADKEAAEREAILAAGGHVIYNNGKAEVVPPPAPTGGVQNKNIKITFGGFIEAAGIYRNHNQTTDIASNWNGGIPFANSPNSHISEFRGTARQSRLSILAQGNLDKNTVLSAWYEMDFLGAAPTANSNESNSYNPRIRNIYGTIDRTDIGLHLLAGQNWSLLTLNRSGITPRSEVSPMTIDAQYVPGFNWTRNPQVRLVKDFDKTLWVGISAESPAALITQGASTPAGIVISNPGTGQLGNGTPASNFTTDPAPDVIAKVAYEPGFGHYEVFGISRWFRSRYAQQNLTTNAAGVGGSALIPVIPKQLDVQISGMIGKGLGRYGSAQLPDATTDNAGNIVALPFRSVLLGVVAHPNKALDLYGYAGTEQVKSRYTLIGTSSYGYGAPTINLAGCYVEGGSCSPNTSRIYQLTGGLWYKFYQGSIGYMQVGFQDSYTKRYVFAGVNGQSPTADLNVAMLSFRYYPF